MFDASYDNSEKHKNENKKGRGKNALSSKKHQNAHQKMSA